MFENDIDSDDDYDGYFLKPANEYNIIDKIKEANKELFSTPKPSSSAEFSDCVNVQQRKVSFRENLEDYEPVNDNNITTEIDEITMNSNDEDINYSTRKSYLIDSDSLEIIKIESSVQEVIESEKNQNHNKNIQNNENDIEEICEEIIELDVKNNSNEAQLMKNENFESMNNEKEMIPLRNSPPPRPYSLNNDKDLLLNCRKTDSDKYDGKANNQNNDNENNNDDDDDDDDDDNLSLIVASYIIDNPKDKFIDRDKKNQNSMINNETITKQSINHRMNPFKICRNNNNTNKQKRQNINDNVMKLKLNYKTCCEYRNIENERLPKYTGYLSEYGLSKEQWDKREKQIETRKKKSLEKHVKVIENESKKNEDNEKAFTNWLKNKMKFPINKTKNMFDYKPTTNKTHKNTIKKDNKTK